MLRSRVSEKYAGNYSTMSTEVKLFSHRDHCNTHTRHLAFLRDSLTARRISRNIYPRKVTQYRQRRWRRLSRSTATVSVKIIRIYDRGLLYTARGRARPYVRTKCNSRRNLRGTGIDHTGIFLDVKIFSKVIRTTGAWKSFRRNRALFRGPSLPLSLPPAKCKRKEKGEKKELLKRNSVSRGRHYFRSPSQSGIDFMKRKRNTLP